MCSIALDRSLTWAQIRREEIEFRSFQNVVLLQDTMTKLDIKMSNEHILKDS